MVLKMKVVTTTKCWQTIGGAIGLVKTDPCATGVSVSPVQAAIQIGTVVITIIPFPVTTTTTTLEEPDGSKNCCRYDCGTHEIEYTSDSSKKCQDERKYVEDDDGNIIRIVTCKYVTEYAGPCRGGRGRLSLSKLTC